MVEPARKSADFILAVYSILLVRSPSPLAMPFIVSAMVCTGFANAVPTRTEISMPAITIVRDIPINMFFNPFTGAKATS